MGHGQSSDVSRRTVLRGVAGVTGGLAIGGAAGVAAAPSAAARAPGYDPEQRFTALVPGGDGVIYGVQADGALVFFRHAGWSSGSREWSNGGGRVIGDGFHQFTRVLASADGQLFGVRADGSIRWYRYVFSNRLTGEGTWAAGSGATIGSGFGQYPRMFGGWGGVLFCVDDNGVLWWYRYTAGNGASGPESWANGGSGRRIGDGWKPFVHLFADPNGVIFGVRQGGALYWWRYLGDGSASGPWAGGGGATKINAGWGDTAFRHVFSNAAGSVYAVALDTGAVPGRDEHLLWYRVLNSETIHTDGSARWANGSGGGIHVGDGFTIERSAALQAYPAALSVRAGGQLGFAVSTTFANFEASAVRLAPDGPERVWGPVSRPGRRQALPEGYRANGCGWQNDVTVPVGSGWRSGVYVLRLTSDLGALPHSALFVVRPPKPSARLAVLLPTNTYNAYNTWGGHDQYTVGEAGRRRRVTFLRPGFGEEALPPGRISHTLHSDLLLLRWLTAQGYDYDLYTDGDLHSDGGWLPGYDALVLASHPEYWSDTMRQRLVGYLDAGGRVVHTGGNGLYERVSFEPDGSALNFRKTTGDRDTYGSLGKSEAQVTGVALGPAYMDFHPYRVVADHPLLAGTGLSVGGLFGKSGYNGAASGWEVDVISPGAVGTVHPIAKGTNPAGGADMVLVEKSGGGWVFSAGSIAFNGALADPAMTRILRNVLERALP